MLVGFILYCYYTGSNYAMNWHQSHGYTETKLDYADDIGHQFFLPLRSWLTANPERLQMACCLSAILSEITGVTVVLVSLFGDTFRPILAMFGTLITRLIIQSFGALRLIPKDTGSIWKIPANWPALFNSKRNNEGSELFFSARIAVATVAFMELLSITLYDN